MNRLYVNTDGGSRGNPGPAAIGVAFTDEENNVLFTYKQCIGVATNNEAEYLAIIKACEILTKSQWYEKNNASGGEVIFRLDSKLVVEQVLGRFKTKEDRMRQLLHELQSKLRSANLLINFIHVPREENKLADKLVNEALDEAKNKVKYDEKS